MHPFVNGCIFIHGLESSGHGIYDVLKDIVWQCFGHIIKAFLGQLVNSLLPQSLREVGTLQAWKGVEELQQSVLPINSQSHEERLLDSIANMTECPLEQLDLFSKDCNFKQ